MAALTSVLPPWWASLRPRSLQAQVTLLIASLSFLPNVALILSAPWIFGYPFFPSLGLVLWIPTLVIACGLIGYVCSYQILKPLTRLAKEAAILGQAEEWESLLRAGDPQETMILRGAFAKLLRQIQVEQERREAVTATLMHDLKTPLIAFQHLLKLLRDRDDFSRQQRMEWLDKLVAECQRLEVLVHKMVQVHRYERGLIKLHPERCDLAFLAQTLTDRLTLMASDRGIRLHTTGNGFALADPGEVERALCNVVENALRYAHSCVTIQVSPHCIEIQDDGPGLPAPLTDLAQPYIMQPVEIAGQRYTAGTGGLGLYIARRIMEAHGGSLSVVRTDDTGTTLRLDWGYDHE